MKTAGIIAMVVLCLLLAGGALIGYTHITVKSPAGILMIKKDTGSFNPIYLNVTSWGFRDFYHNPRLKRAMIDREIPDFNNIRAKLIAADKAVSLGFKLEEIADRIEQGILEFDKKHGLTDKLRELDDKYKIRETLEKTGDKMEDIGRKLKDTFRD